MPERLKERAPSGTGQSADALIASDRILALICAAAIGAAYLAFGWERVGPAVVESFRGEIEEALENPVDFKSELQERLARAPEVVEYLIESEDGPPHDRRFVALARRWTAKSSGVAAARRRRRPSSPRHRGARAAGGGRALMHLRSISLKGFKSFPDRTKLDFAPGVSVIVGPNGSGKSNITDAVLGRSASRARWRSGARRCRT